MNDPHPNPPSDLHFGAAVYAADGSKIGTLHRLVIDGDVSAVHSLVVAESDHFAGHSGNPDVVRLFPDVIIQIDHLASATHDRVDLNLQPTDVRNLPPYIHHEFVMASGSNGMLEKVERALGSPVPPMNLIINKALRDLEIEQGENVMIGHDGDKLGIVRDVVTSGGELTGVIVRPTGWFTHDVVLPSRVFGRSDDLALFVRLSRTDLTLIAARFVAKP